MEKSSLCEIKRHGMIGFHPGTKMSAVTHSKEEIRAKDPGVQNMHSLDMHSLLFLCDDISKERTSSLLLS